MKKNRPLKTGQKTPYQKPKWEKVPLLERFAMACTQPNAKAATCSVPGQRYT